MRLRPVEAVWVWRYTLTPFRATYGRLPGTKYTKDFLQVSGDCADVLDDVLGREPGDRTELRYRWPGGERTGPLFPASDDNPPERRRLELRWETDRPPEPWRLSPNPTESPLATFPGNPNHGTEDEADAEWEALEQQDLDPWLVVVKLWGESDVLHVRAYLGDPPEGLEQASADNLPAQVREAMSQVPAGGGCRVVQFPSLPDVRAKGLVGNIIEALQRGPNVLLVGPPGTGKTVALEDLRGLYEDAEDWVLFDPEALHDAWHPKAVRRTRSVVFHSSYSYEEFVLGLLPRPAKSGAGAELVPHPGPLLSLGHWASQRGNAALLTVDEFNRGNAAAIFGDTLALLDDEKRADPVTGLPGAVVDRPYPDLDVEVSESLRTNAGTTVGPEVRLPANLGIVTALNSSDRSVAPLDAALRRRFSIMRVEPDYEVLTAHFGFTEPVMFDTDDGPADWSRTDALALAVDMLRELNQRIELVLGSDFLLGHALLWKVEGDTTPEVIKSLCSAFDERVAGTLRMTFSNQDELLAGVLNAGQPPASPQPPPEGESVASWVVPPSHLEAVAAPRLRIRVTQDMAWENAARAFRALL